MKLGALDGLSDGRLVGVALGGKDGLPLELKLGDPDGTNEGYLEGR